MGIHDKFIDRLTVDPTDRAALRAVAAGMESNPMFAGRAEAILQELARPAPETHADGRQFTGEDCLAYAGSFMEAIGFPADMASSTLGAINQVDFDAISTQAIEDAGLVEHLDRAMRDDPDGYARSPDAQRAYAEALERLNAPRVEPSYWTDVDDRRLTEIERKHMRAAPGSQEWREYWQGPLHSEYGELLTRKMAPSAPPETEPASEMDIQPSGLHGLPGYYSWSTE
jgi:hypothetical protein